MPNMKNAIKKVKQTKKVTEANRHINSTVKNAIKNNNSMDWILSRREKCKKYIMK